MIDRYLIHGHAIVSADDRIAGRDGVTPAALRNEADWARFQLALDRAVLTVLGRRGHEANPNVKHRRRLVLSSSACGVERRADAWWWNPADTPAIDALKEAAPVPGIVAVPGGRSVFDLFLEIGFDEFHLARANRVTIPDGIPVFSDVLEGRTAPAILAGRGLVAGPRETLNAGASVDLIVWRQP